jgi:hypothetical protein
VGAAVFRYGREVPVQAAGVLRVPMSTTADATQAVSGASSPSDLSCYIAKGFSSAGVADVGALRRGARTT